MKEERNGDRADTDDNKEGEEHIEEKTTTSAHSATKANKASMDYWFTKVLEYETSMQDEQSSRAIRWHHKQTYKKDSDEMSHRNYKNFTLERIKERIKNAERVFSDYLSNWGSRWAKPNVKEEIVSCLLSISNKSV